MRLIQFFAVMLGIMVFIQSIGWSEETPGPEPQCDLNSQCDLEPTNVRRGPLLLKSDIANPIIQRIDALTWDDQEIIDALKTLDPKRQAALLKHRDDPKQRLVPYQIRNIIKLKYVDQGGAVLPVSGKPTPWVYAPLQPIVSLGMLPCHNSMDEAKRVAKETDKPILKLSTELPGCSACTGLGGKQLSHPLVVDAATEFVPVVVSGGWPYVVVLDAEGNQVGERATHKTSVGGLLKVMRDGLRELGRDVPEWLDLITEEYNAERETTAFAMGCFWSGERILGKLDGVLATRVGSRQGRGEWVEVEFDPAVISYEKLVKTAAEKKCTGAIIARTDKQAEIAKDYVANPERLYRDDQSRVTPPKNPSADKHSIYNSKRYGNLPMTPCQATRINAMGSSAEKYLSPSQVIFLKRIEELMADGAEVRDFPKPDWTSLDNFGSDARNLQAKLGLLPKRIW